jgi:hypothetical protein
LVPKKFKKCETSRKVPGRKAAPNDPRLIMIEVEARNVAAII